MPAQQRNDLSAGGEPARAAGVQICTPAPATRPSRGKIVTSSTFCRCAETKAPRQVNGALAHSLRRNKPSRQHIEDKLMSQVMKGRMVPGCRWWGLGGHVIHWVSPDAGVVTQGSSGIITSMVSQTGGGA